MKTKPSAYSIAYRAQTSGSIKACLRPRTSLEELLEQRSSGIAFDGVAVHLQRRLGDLLVKRCVLRGDAGEVATGLAVIGKGGGGPEGDRFHAVMVGNGVNLSKLGKEIFETRGRKGSGREVSIGVFEACRVKRSIVDQGGAAIGMDGQPGGGHVG